MATVKHLIPFKKNYFEHDAWKQSQLICGIDEAGRGCLAGPVVIGAAIIPTGTTYRLLKDSKLLNKAELLQAYTWIQKNCWYSYVAFDHKAIDTHNIYQATLKGMRRAFMQIMACKPGIVQTVCVDAMPLNLQGSSYEGLNVAYFNKGEKHSSSIAAASIVAKVNRDRIMELHEQAVPGYDFQVHKGYATPHHKQRIHAHGASLIHRNSFTISSVPETGQQSII
jgi:ribonuclease HII